MRRVTWVAAAAGLAALAGCGATDRAGDVPETPAPAAPTSPRVQQQLPASATQIRGWDIHYRDGDEIKVLRVEDLPR